MADFLDITKLIHFTSGNKGKGLSALTGTACTADSVNIIFNIFRNIEIKDTIYIADINTSCRNISCKKKADPSASEKIHNRITLVL